MKKYLFDFDGTLVDSMPTFVKVMLDVLDKNNIKYTNDIVKIITPLGYEGAAKYFISLGVKKPLEDLILEMKEKAFNEYAYNILAKEEVINTLIKLTEKGNSLNILTASPQVVLVPCLKRLNIYHLFDNVWSCDDFNTTKADPNIYKMVAERLMINTSDIIFLDDNINGLKTAKETGVIIFGVYDETSKDYEEDIKKIADKYIYNFKELL